MRGRIKIHHWEIQIIHFNKIYINTTFDQTKKNRQIKKFQLIIPHDSKIRNSLSTKLKFHQKYVAAKRISFQKKESLNVTNNFNFQFSKKKNLIPSIARDTTNPNPFTNFPNILLLSFPPLSRYFTFLTLKPRLNINPLHIPIDDGRKTSVASIVPPLLRVSNFLYPANVIAG